MSDEKWAMPDEIQNKLFPEPKYYEPYAFTISKQELREVVMEHVGKVCDELRTAGLLLTPGERDKRAEAMAGMYLMGTESDADIDRLRAENEKMRELLWLNHGCGGIPYGDDGERQCGRCGVDFKRWPPDQIKSKWRANAERAALGDDDE